MKPKLMTMMLERARRFDEMSRVKSKRKDHTLVVSFSILSSLVGCISSCLGLSFLVFLFANSFLDVMS